MPTGCSGIWPLVSVWLLGQGGAWSWVGGKPCLRRKLHHPRPLYDPHTGWGGQSSNKEKWVTSAGLRVQENPELKIPDCIHQTLPTPGLSALLHSWSSATTTGNCRAENSPSEALLFLRWSLGLCASLSVLRLQEMRVSLRTTNTSPAIFWFLSSMLSPSPSLGTPLPLNRAVVLEAPPQ